ncbi:hypothetical protein ANN_05513 [Periplaneta americana]|uniref:DUF4817 domain-containing protein n=1 Tax=Periplaneta americana TaxID=6978 RepID=A0ABQ8TD31_PERAM|nr:hypothetical protein ANN_05513 [Periplaneta americana]
MLMQPSVTRTPWPHSFVMLLEFLAVVLVLFYLVRKVCMRRMVELAEQIPGPKTLPFIGNGLEFGTNTKDVFRSVMRLMKRYPSISRYWLGDKLLIMLVDREFIEHFFIMDRWTCDQRPFAIKAYYKNNYNSIATQRLFRCHYNIHRNDPIPSAHDAIKIWIQNFEVSGSALKKKSPGKQRSVCTQENINAVRVAMIRSPKRSASRHAISLGLSNTSIPRILHKGLHMHPYKIQVVQTLKDADKVNRNTFRQQFWDLNINDDIVHNMLMSDEAHFHLSGYVNKQNFRYWSPTNP